MANEVVFQEYGIGNRALCYDIGISVRVQYEG